LNIDENIEISSIWVNFYISSLFLEGGFFLDGEQRNPLSLVGNGGDFRQFQSKPLIGVTSFILWW